MAKFVEARIGYKDLISFSCTNPDDLNLLVQKMRGEQKWKVNVICSDESDSSQYNAEIPISDLRYFVFCKARDQIFKGIALKLYNF